MMNTAIKTVNELTNVSLYEEITGALEKITAFEELKPV